MAEVTTFGYAPLLAQALVEQLSKASASSRTSDCATWPP
jgi:hypothetical protein